MSIKGKIASSLFAVAVLMVIIGIAASGAPNGPKAATTPSGPRANVPAGAMNVPHVDDGIWTQKAPEKILPNGVRVIQDTKHDVSPPLRDIPAAVAVGAREEEANENAIPFAAVPGKIDTVVQRSFGPLVMPTPILTFAGIGNPTACGTCLPPDTNGDVGPNHYVQTVNTKFAVWDKSGNVLLAPVAINTLFAGFGGPCQIQNSGDPVVNYDSIADRWVINQFTSSAPYYQCFAVSTTPDPTGAYYRYGFQESLTNLYDYPHSSVWPDAYYMSANVFGPSSNFLNPSVFAFDRAKMLAGQPATAQEFNPGNYFFNLLPGDLDGPTLPPAGAPNPFVTAAGTNSTISLWKFHVDWTTPANSTFTGPINIDVAPFDPNMCGGSRNCIPQPNTTAKLDAGPGPTYYRFAYRNMGSYQTSVISHVVDENGADHAGVRWYEIRDPAGNPFVYQQGTYAPDADHRWMASQAMDRDGNIAIGYSVSSSTTFPSIRYAGRLANDPLGLLAQGEATLIAGTGSQTSSSGRWGDYSAMQVDPTDDCTFWYTTEYYPTTGGSTWQTRIGSFKFPSCGGAPAPTSTPGGPTSTPLPTSTATAQPSPTACANYTVTTGTDTIVPGTDDTTNHCDDCATYITLPFTIRLYEGAFNNAYISSNGNIQFASSNFAFGNACLPVPVYNYAAIVYWDDLVTNCAGCGVFTSVTGSAPTRIFNVEWRTQILGANNASANFEARFYEGSNQVDFVYAAIIANPADYTIGMERDMGAFTQVACGVAPIVPNTKYTFMQPCGLITATPAPPTSTATGTATRTATTGPSSTPQSTAEATATSTACTITFTDVDENNVFYSFIRCLACRGIIGGYDDGTFRPFNDITRGQIAKIVSNAAGFDEDPGPQIYEDVPVGSPFYQWINRLSMRGHIGGYPCGLVEGEPCTEPDNLPYFRPSNSATRGQLAKIVSNAAGLTKTPTGQFYTDVPEGHPFYIWIMRLTNEGVMSGYDCGGDTEPCDDQQRPYFRPYNNVTRGQASKIVANTFFPGCETPSR
jgi:hypothetical protein